MLVAGKSTVTGPPAVGDNEQAKRLRSYRLLVSEVRTVWNLGRNGACEYLSFANDGQVPIGERRLVKTLVLIPSATVAPVTCVVTTLSIWAIAESQGEYLLAPVFGLAIAAIAGMVAYFCALRVGTSALNRFPSYSTWSPKEVREGVFAIADKAVCDRLSDETKVQRVEYSQPRYLARRYSQVKRLLKADLRACRAEVRAGIDFNADPMILLGLKAAIGIAKARAQESAALIVPSDLEHDAE